MTEVLRLDNKATYKHHLKQAYDALCAGGLVGIPTETVYGILANAENKDSIAKLITMLLKILGLKKSTSGWSGFQPQKSLSLSRFQTR